MNFIYHRCNDLIVIIYKDLYRYCKLPLFLLFLILIFAISVVTVTSLTRQLIIKREQLLSENDALDIEWRNLILELNVLGAPNRIEYIASKKLYMKHIDPTKENIVFVP